MCDFGGTQMEEDFESPTLATNQLFEDSTESIDLSRVFTRELTTSGSFDIRGEIWKTTFGKLMQALPIPALLVDKALNIVTTNQACGRMSPSYEELKGEAFSSLLPDDSTASKTEALMEEIFSTRKPRIALGTLSVHGSQFWCRLTFRCLRIMRDRLLLVLIEDLSSEKKQLTTSREQQEKLEMVNEQLRLEIRERKKAEEALRSEKSRFECLARSSPVGMVLIGTEGEYQYLNPKFTQLFGYTLEDIPDGRVWFRKAFPDPEARHQVISTWLEDLKQAEEGEMGPRIFNMTCKDGSAKTVHFRVVQLETGEHLMTCEDITARVKAEERIRASVGEKEILLREIHHRVKNNLQVIQSLVRLQERRVGDDRHRKIFRDVENRIRSLALVHEKLYTSKQLATLKAKDYVLGLVDYLLGAYTTSATKPAVKTHFEEIALSLDDAIPLGFIITELLTNCLVHAFPEGERGQVSISLVSCGEDESLLTVADNGQGIPEDIEIGDPKFFGLDLVRIFAEQLNGGVEIIRDAGTEFRIRFRGVDRE
jgi:PAS domain S-box-containing protein